MSLSSRDDLNKHEQKYALFTCNVRGDGMGDLGHFAEVTKAIIETPEFKSSGLVPLFIVSGGGDDPSIHRIGHFKSLLKNKGFNPDSNNFIFESHTGEVKNITQGEWPKKLTQTQAMFNVSVPDLDIYSKYNSELKNYLAEHLKNIPCTTIAEHGGKTTSTRNLYESKLPDQSMYVGMDFGTHGRGILLKKEEEKGNEADRLSSINPVLLNHILSRQEKDSIPLSESIRRFLAKSTLTPCYFQTQDAPDMLAIMMSSMATSELIRKKEEIVFITNTESIYSDKNNYQEFMKKNNISEITIVSSFGGSITEETIQNQAGETKKEDVENTPLKVRILAGFKPNDRDFSILHQCAQFGGSSGDKSLEEKLANNLITFSQIRNYKKTFFEHFKQYAETLLGPNNMVTRYIDCLFKAYNVIEKCHSFILTSDFPGVNFGDIPREIRSTMTGREKIDYVISKSQAAKAAYIEKLQPIARELGEVLTSDFQTQWLRLLDDMYKNQNLYNEIPDIVRATFDRNPEIKYRSDSILTRTSESKTPPIMPAKSVSTSSLSMFNWKTSINLEKVMDLIRTSENLIDNNPQQSFAMKLKAKQLLVEKLIPELEKKSNNQLSKAQSILENIEKEIDELRPLIGKSIG